MLKITLEQPGRFAAGRTCEPAAAPQEAIVAVHRIGVCGTDIHAFYGRHPFIKYPIVLGHELSGVVLEAPPNDRGVKAGGRVSIEPFRPCGQCHACRTGRANCCERMHVIGIHGDGGMRLRIAVPVEFLHPSGKLSLDQLATIEPLSIGARAIQRGQLREGESVLIVGAGPIGLAALQFALLEGGRVTVLEVDDGRRQWVEQTYGVPTTAARDDRRYNLVVDATGNPKAMNESFCSVEHAGRLVFVGVIKAKISFDDAILHEREITLLASRNSTKDFPRIIGLIEQGRFDPTAWITHRMKLDEVPDRFADVTAQPGVVKPMIEVVQE